MVSSDTRVQIVAMALAAFVLAAFAILAPEDPGMGWLAAFLTVFYAITFGGAHLYLYLRGEGGDLPRSARGRFLLTLGIVIPLWVGGFVLQDATILSVPANLLLGGISVVVFAVYFITEARSGYGTVRSASDSR